MSRSTQRTRSAFPDFLVPLAILALAEGATCEHLALTLRGIGQVQNQRISYVRFIGSKDYEESMHTKSPHP